MFKKKLSYGPASDKLLSAWPLAQKHKKKISWSVDTGNAFVYIAMLVIMPLIALVITFYDQRNERIDCDNLTMSSVRYLDDAGEELPASCLIL